MEEKVLTVVQETEILGKKIKMYGSIECPWFLARDVAEWIDYSKSNGKFQISNMLKKLMMKKRVLKVLIPLVAFRKLGF